MLVGAGASVEDENEMTELTVVGVETTIEVVGFVVVGLVEVLDGLACEFVLVVEDSVLPVDRGVVNSIVAVMVSAMFGCAPGTPSQTR